eukprot:COSAG06_NODE_3126_length_5809_cov_11.619089_2_plen_162_part_00
MAQQLLPADSSRADLASARRSRVADANEHAQRVLQPWVRSRRHAAGDNDTQITVVTAPPLAATPSPRKAGGLGLDGDAAGLAARRPQRQGGTVPVVPPRGPGTGRLSTTQAFLQRRRFTTGVRPPSGALERNTLPLQANPALPRSPLLPKSATSRRPAEEI